MMRLTLIFGLVFTFTSCLKDKTIEPAPPGPCEIDTISFATEVQGQIIDISCNTSGCHDATASGGYSFLDHASISSKAPLILDALNQTNAGALMPQGGDKIVDSLIQKFDCWIQQGMLDN